MSIDPKKIRQAMGLETRGQKSTPTGKGYSTAIVDGKIRVMIYDPSIKKSKYLTSVDSQREADRIGKHAASLVRFMKLTSAA